MSLDSAALIFERKKRAGNVSGNKLPIYHPTAKPVPSGGTVHVNNLKQPETAKSFSLIGKRFTATTIAAVPAGSGAV